MTQGQLIRTELRPLHLILSSLTRFELGRALEQGQATSGADKCPRPLLIIQLATHHHHTGTQVFIVEDYQQGMSVNEYGTVWMSMEQCA